MSISSDVMRVAGGIDRSPGTPRQPVTSVHNDYTVKSGPQRVRDLMGEEAEEVLRHRFEIVNVWRPIRGPLRDAPLAVCDATSVAFADFVPSDLVYRDRIGETYRVRYNPAHQAQDGYDRRDSEQQQVTADEDRGRLVR